MMRLFLVFLLRNMERQDKLGKQKYVYSGEDVSIESRYDDEETDKRY